jgi:molecular chaperone DnaK
MANLIGIDLGTSTTLMAVLNAAGEPEIVKNEEGDNLTYSAVLFESDSKATIGKEAKKLLGFAEDGRIFVEYKRDMHDDSVVHTVDGKQWRPRDFSALVLKKLRLKLESEQKSPDAVNITLRAKFKDEARVKTLLAGKDAGFDLREDALINEPTAAALYYITRTGANIQGKCLVYDFGGGTFDATILDVKGDDIQVLTSNGVQHLGGKDLDDKLLELIGKKFSTQTNASFDPKAQMVSKWDIEQHKHTLSVRDKVDIVIRSPEHGTVRFQITRDEFESTISSLIAQANMAVETALDNAKLRTVDINHVFLAGGTTRIPAIASSVEKLIGKKPYTDNPDEAVAKGAAIYAGIRNKGLLGSGQKRTIGDKKVTDVSPGYYGTIIYTGQGILKNKNLIDKDEPLPASKTETFYRGPEHGNRIRVQISQSANATDDPDLVAIVLDEWWRNLPEVTENSEIIVTYSYDSNGIVNCKFVDKASGNVFERELTSKGNNEGKNDANAGDIDDILL